VIVKATRDVYFLAVLLAFYAGSTMRSQYYAGSTMLRLCDWPIREGSIVYYARRLIRRRIAMGAFSGFNSWVSVHCYWYILLDSSWI